MKILLVKPPSTTNFDNLPLGIGYLGTYLKNKISDIEVIILDCSLKRYNHDDFIKSVTRIQPNVVGVSAYTMEVYSALKCCKLVKELNSQIVTVIGGPHATFAPEEVLSSESVDFIFRGEAEKAFYEFIMELRGKRNFIKIPNLGLKIHGKIYLNPLKTIDNIDELPFLDYELLNFKQYPKTYKMKHYPSAAIITSRGCPFPCTFCSGNIMSGKIFRPRKPENLIKEIKELKENYNIKEFEIWDDNFTLDKKRANEFCDLLIKEKINLPWWCPNGLRVETLDEELIRKMKRSGLYSIALGIESGSEKIQKDMKKNLDFDKMREVIGFGNKYKIRMEGFFILGYPTETREDILKTIKMAKDYL